MSVAEKLTEIAENVPRVYDSGFANGEQKGHEEGYSKGATDGARSANNDWWQRFQKGGNRTNYDYAFSNADGSQIEWNLDTVRPVYAMSPTTARYMFAELAPEGELNLVKRLEECGSAIDFSNCKDFYHMLENSGIVRIGEIDATGADTLNYIFYGNRTLRFVDKLIVHKDLEYEGAFTNCTRLTDITIEGTIGHSIQLHRGHIPFSKASITSFMNALRRDLAVMAKISFSLSTIRRAFGTEDSEEWLKLVDQVQHCWTVELR